MKKSKFYLICLSVILFSCNTGYENDGEKVYYNYWNEGSGSHKVELDANPETFKILDHDRYAKDDKNVWFDGEIVKDADAETFESIHEWYGRDKNSGFRTGAMVQGSQGKSFELIDKNYYSTDGIDVFYDTLPLKVCSAKNFVILTEEDGPWKWTTDGCFYYYMSWKIPSADYKNVTYFEGSNGLAKDLKYVYFGDHLLNYNDEGERIIDTIDAASFTVSGLLDCKDKWGCINIYWGREDCEK